jgi:hypothetical protein
VACDGVVNAANSVCALKLDAAHWVVSERMLRKHAIRTAFPHAVSIILIRELTATVGLTATAA